MKRITNIKERKKMEAKGLEVHQAMLQMFEERFGTIGFGMGFESSESGSMRSSEEMSEQIDEQKRFFDDIMRIKERVSFDTTENCFQLDLPPSAEKTLSRSRTWIRSQPSMSAGTSKERIRPAQDLAAALRKTKLTEEALKGRTYEEDEERGSVASSREPLE